VRTSIDEKNQQSKSAINVLAHVVVVDQYDLISPTFASITTSPAHKIRPTTAQPTEEGTTTPDDRGADGGGEGGNKRVEGVEPTAPTRPLKTGEPTGEDTAAVTYEPTEEDPVEELMSRPTQKPTIDDIGEGTGGLIEEPSRDGLGMNLFGLATDDGGQLEELGMLMGNDGGAADHPANHGPIVDSPERLSRRGTPKKNPTGRTNESSRARQMKGLKRKRRFTRNIQGPQSTDHKSSTFDHAAFREVNAVLPTQRIDYIIAPAKARGLLSKVKRDRHILKASLAASAQKRHSLEIKSQCDQDKIAQLKLSNNQLKVDILRERRASNKIIDEAMVEARRLSAEALEMMSKANDMCDEAEAKIIAERNRASARLREERAHHSRESVQCRQKQVAAIDKLHQVQASLVEEIQSNSKKKLCKVREKQLSSVEEIQSKSKNKLCNVREKVVMLSTKLKEQHSIWQKRLAEIDSSSKNRISNERQIRRNLIQNQLDRTSALKSQLMEIIEGLEVMNSELVDEVKAAKKGMREADRLYNKTKEAAAKQLGQLRQEKKEKNQLKDELTRVLKAQEAQEAQLDKYKSMVKSFQSTKRSLKPEIKIGRRGGASWPLWVTDLSVLAASVRLLAFWGGGSR
jgi:hypothetical protein